MDISRRAFLGGTLAAAAGAGASEVMTGSPPARGKTREPGGASAPATAPAGGCDDQAHTDRLFREIPRRLAFRAQTAKELRAWQGELKQRLLDLLGLTNMAREVPFAFRAERAERVALDGYTREKWYLWTEPDVPLPIWLLIPERPAGGATGDAPAPSPLVIVVHGHNDPELYLGIARSEQQRKSLTEGDRDIAVQAVRQGYLTVHLTARGFGETRRADDRKAGKTTSCRTAMLHALLFGRTMIGCRVWDVSRVLDWITRRLPVDTVRVAITGNSGGGTTSVFAAACEPRIRVAMPSCYFCTFQASIGSVHHCECNYVPGLLREAEMYEVAGLIAPRPFLAIAGQGDPLFPVAAVREAHARLRAIYRVAGAAERCELFVGEGGHRYYKAPAWPFVAKWFERAEQI